MSTHFAFKCQLLICLICAVAATNAVPAEPTRAANAIVVIDKAEKSLVLLKHGRQAARFPATFGLDPDSDKTRKHDLATPEGLYLIVSKQSTSRFNQLMGLSYPNLANAEKGLAAGVISLGEYRRIAKAVQKPNPMPCGTRLGCGIAIHGGGVFRYSDHTRERDWTEGCVALDDTDMEKLFRACRPGDPVIIFNSRRNLYGIIRPFTRVTERDAEGIPRCPNNICTYALELFTALGRTRISIKEGGTYGRSLHVAVDSGDATAKPHLVIVDRNADGYLSPLDRVDGSVAGETTPEATYAKVQEAVLATLRSGQIAIR